MIHLHLRVLDLPLPLILRFGGWFLDAPYAIPRVVVERVTGSARDANPMGKREVLVVRQGDPLGYLRQNLRHGWTVVLSWHAYGLFGFWGSITGRRCTLRHIRVRLIFCFRSGTSRGSRLGVALAHRFQIAFLLHRISVITKVSQILPE